ncbi:unnamed protein product [Phytophthora lilii]|uniref:Unnamed protein product n=1 Tax=Phytophthora lilii TaxID=2077276 RepID=A0A9W6WGW0_9STRA|nr:unnamed protein product [Phytophthora lilii]
MAADRLKEVLGGAIKKGVAVKVWSREGLVISTKLYYGYKGVSESGPNDQGLTRKHVIENTQASLGRLGLDYVDVIFCHRPDPHTPIEETVRAMNHVISKGWAFYWGASEWLPSQIYEACEIADRLNLIRPIVAMEQSQYNIFECSRVEYAFVDLYKKYKLGLTTWSPLAFGTLTGKYTAGTPEGSRFTTPMIKSGPFHDGFEERVKTADQLKPIAAELGCSLPQMSTAWAVANEKKKVSTVLIGASRTRYWHQVGSPKYNQVRTLLSSQLFVAYGTAAELKREMFVCCLYFYSREASEVLPLYDAMLSAKLTSTPTY